MVVPVECPEVEPDQMADAAVAEELLALRATIDRLEGRFALLADAAHRRGLGSSDGSPSTAAWLRRRTGMREGEARAALEAGAACEDVLVDTGRAWRAGEITAGAARTIVAARRRRPRRGAARRGARLPGPGA